MSRRDQENTAHSRALLLLLSLSGLGSPAAAPPRAHPPDEGRRLIQRFECNRCHDGTGVAPAPRDKHCVHCHQAIRAGSFRAPPEALRRWQGNLKSLPYAPSLVAIGARLQRGWVERFLLDPHDLRPGLVATMPRLELTPADARALAAALVPREAAPGPPPPGDAALLAAGRALLASQGCATCHRYSGIDPPLASPLAATPGGTSPRAPVQGGLPAELAEGMALAPDLRHTRQRFQLGALRAWLRDPPAMKPGTAMPQTPLTEAQLDALIAFLWNAPLSPESAPAPPLRLPPLERRVSWSEVNDKVFRRTCWHCHSTPEYAMGDGGPGNTGGFGFRGRGLNVASYTDLAAGSIGDDGERRSVFLPVADGVPRLVAHLLARHAEVAGKPVAGVRGMPLGLPPLGPEDIQLVDSWIAQGRPR